MLRVFIGIKITDDLSKKVEKWKAVHKNFPVRFVDKTNLHLTLIPPLYVHSNEVNKLIYTLKPLALNIKPFNIKFTQISFGPNPKRPRLIWATGPKVSDLSNHRKKITKALNRQEEKRTFVPHLTIARFKPEIFKEFEVKKLAEKINWKQKVNSFTLFESKLSRSKPQYTKLHEFYF